MDWDKLKKLQEKDEALDENLIEKLQKKSERKRRLSPMMNKAYREDEAIRKMTQEKSYEYLNKKSYCKSRSFWFFILGIVIGLLFGSGLMQIILH